MTRAITLSCLLASSIALNAQCTGIDIYPTFVVIDANGTYTHNYDSLWVCGGVTVTINGVLNRLYVENNANVTVNDNYNLGWVKSGSTYTNNGDSCVVAFETGANVNDNGIQNTVYPCIGPMTFDYTNAPPIGCAGIGFAEQTPAAYRVQLVPNPADHLMNVVVSGAVVRSMVAIDQSGREVLRAPGGLQPTVDVSKLEVGNYMLRIETDKGTSIEKFTRR